MLRISIFLSTLIFVALNAFSQETKKIKSKEHDEVFYVLKTDPSIRHGEYKSFGRKNQILIHGYYKNGVRDSIWKCYDFDQKLSLEYDFRKDTVIYYNPKKITRDKRYKVIRDGAITDISPSRPPMFLGGDDLVISEFLKTLRYPSNALENGKSGIVYVQFTVDKNGKTSNYRVAEGLGYGLDEEALKMVKLLPDNWLHGLYNGQPVDVEVTIPVKFRFE